MITVGDEFRVAESFAPEDECGDGDCIEKIIEKTSKREDDGDIVALFGIERLKDDEVVNSWSAVSETSLERAIRAGDLVPVDGDPFDYIRLTE